jgi:hypothetical protein
MVVYVVSELIVRIEIDCRVLMMEFDENSGKKEME